MVDLGFCGFPFTWSNHQGNNLIEERLNHGLDNASWSDLFPSAYIKHLILVGSDHSSIILYTDNFSPNISKPFKFFCVYLKQQGCKEVIVNTWKVECRGSHVFQLVNKLANVRFFVQLWNMNHFGNIQNNIKTLQTSISEILTNDSFRSNDPRLLETKVNLSKMYIYEEEILKIKGKKK